MKISVRCNALTLEKLRAQEDHGKRLDRSSQRRRIRESAPIVGGGLDLVDRLTAHTDGTKQNKAARNVALHFIVKYPPEILGDGAPAPFQGLSKRDRQKEMARQASRFIQETHGGQAVFAVRVDTDEAGEVVVDVFACPKYVKTTKKAETTWTSLTKFGKDLARKHQDEVRRRSPEHEGPDAITSPRAVGMSLQSEFAAFFERVNGVKPAMKVEKNTPGSDRLEVEAWRLRQMQADAVEAQAEAEAAAQERDRAEAQAESVRAQTKAEKEAFRKQAREWVEREKVVIASKHQAAAADRAAAAADMMTARTVLDRLKETYQAVRQSIPRIRQILTWDLATEDERRRAKMDRRQVVKVSPILRNAIRDAESQAGRVSVPVQQAGPETADRSDDFSM
jgi:hypothetical protein